MNDPINKVDPSGKFSLKTLTVGAGIAASLAYITYKISYSPYIRGLDTSNIKNEDILRMMTGVQHAATALDEVMTRNPTSFDDLWDKLGQYNVHQIGQYGKGVVSYGFKLTEGEQQIVKYFESGLWNSFNPRAHKHPLLVTYKADPEGFLQRYHDAESQRLNIIIMALREEAERRGLRYE